MAYHRCSEFKKEINALRAKVAEMERQEPVAFALYSGWARKAVYLSEIEACEQRDRRQLTADLGGSLEAYRVVPLYRAPGAQPAPIEQDTSVRKAWSRFSNELHRSPDAPYPGMSEAFEKHFSQSFTDREWRAESGTWAAAWKAAKRHEAQAQPAQRMNMQTADQITQAFKAELQALLDKYGAELSARDTWEGYPECGEDVRMQVNVPAIYDADHNCLREYTEIDLGSWVPSTQAMPKEAKP